MKLLLLHPDAVPKLAYLLTDYLQQRFSTLASH